MRISTFLVILLFPVLANAEANENSFTPGEPMRFPMKSDGVADHLVQLYSVNCETDDIAINSRCIALLQERADRCTVQPPEVFEHMDSYRAWASEFSACVFPRPICKGIEVSNELDRRKHCNG